MFVTRVTSSNNVSPSRGNNEVSGTPVRGDVVDLTDDATTSAASNHNGSVDAAPTAYGFVGNFPNVDVGRNRGDLELDVVVAEESTARACAARQSDISPKESTARTCAAHACAARTDR